MIKVKGYAYVKVPFIVTLDITPMQYQEMKDPELIRLVNEQLDEETLLGGELSSVDWMGYERIE